MKFSEFDHVRIKGKNVTGEIIHAYEDESGHARYTIECDEEGPIDDPDAWNDVRFPQFVCDEDQLEKI